MGFTSTNNYHYYSSVTWPLYRTTCISHHPQLRTRGFCWSKDLLPACPCWLQPVHSVYGDDAAVLLNGITCSVSVPSHRFCTTLPVRIAVIILNISLNGCKWIKLFNEMLAHNTSWQRMIISLWVEVTDQQKMSAVAALADIGSHQPHTACVAHSEITALQTPVNHHIEHK